MSLRKPPTLTHSRLEANRRSSKNSTGPRTARGKSQSSLNSLRTGNRSRLMHAFYLTLFNAPPGAVDRVARGILTPQLAAHPLFAETVDLFRGAENALMREPRKIHPHAESDRTRASGKAKQPPAQEFFNFLRGLESGEIAQVGRENRGEGESCAPGEPGGKIIMRRTKPECV
jgi:hypothetical protein